METKHTIDYPKASDVMHIAVHMREADKQEVMASSGSMPLSAVVESERISVKTRVHRIDGEPVAIYGIASPTLLSLQGFPWMLGTDKAIQNKRAFLEHSREALEDIQKGYTHLANYVDARNTASKLWLKKLGFTLHDPEPYGVQGLPFHLFTKGVACVSQSQLR